MGATLLGGLVLVFGRGFLSQRTADTGNTRVDLTAIAPDTIYWLPWRSRLLLVQHRNEAQRLAVYSAATELLDPESVNSRQPASWHDASRSANVEWFVAFAYGTSMSCPLEWIEPGSQGTPLASWPGGYLERCVGVWYDLGGRVYKGPQALRNLDVPNYRIEGDELLLEQ